MKLSQLTLTACAAMLVSGAALAEPKAFDKVDANGDGMINTAEFANSGVEGQTLAKLDKDGNGSLNEDEYSVVLEEECE